MHKILYVDDEPGLLEICKIFLENDGTLSVDTALSAVDALNQLETAQYDAIVSDFQMPEMDGISLLKKIRSKGDLIPFIIFTGKGREEVVIEAINSGVDYYIQKGGNPTVQFAELAHKIRRAVQKRQADIAVRKSERGYRHLIEYANEAIYVTQDNVLKLVNPKVVLLSGYSEQELLNQPFTTFVHPEDREMILERFRKRIAGEDVPDRYPFRVLRKDGAVRWIELSVVAIFWDEKPATLNYVTDITDRRHAEDALRESEELYRQFFRTTRDAVFITTPDGHWIDFNDAMVEMFGYTNRDEVNNISVNSVYEHRKDRMRFHEQVERQGYVKEYPVRLRKRDGTIFHALITSVLQKNPDGSVKSFIGTFRDITNRKQAERALLEKEERYRLFFKTTLDSVFITTPGGEFIDFNEALMEHLGTPNRERLNTTNVISVYAHPEERIPLLEQVQRKGFVRKHPLKLKKLNGTVIDTLMTVVPQTNPDGSMRAYIGSFRDLADINDNCYIPVEH